MRETERIVCLKKIACLCIRVFVCLCVNVLMGVFYVTVMCETGNNCLLSWEFRGITVIIRNLSFFHSTLQSLPLSPFYYFH